MLSNDNENMADEETNTTQEIVENGVTLEDGPFGIFDIIGDLPTDLTYTCCEAYEEHVYLGTANGELLHYFEMEKGTYLLVSRVKFNESASSIDKIVLLPKLERACVLSQNQLILYILPEFAPVPNMGSLDEVNDIKLTGRDKLLIFAKEWTSFYKIERTKFVPLKKIPQLKNIEHALLKSKTLFIAQENSYEMIKLTSNETLPLFKICEDIESHIKPIICDFNDNEVLICTGGKSYEDNAMALVVNLEGDITQGTIALERYPQEVLINYPYILVNFHNKEIYIYKLVPNDEPKLEQRIKCNNDGMQIAFNKTLTSFLDTNLTQLEQEERDKLVNKLKLVPLAYEMDKSVIEFKLEKERSIVRKLLNNKTRFILYSNSHLYGIFKKSILLEINNFNETEIKNIEEYLGTIVSYENLNRREQMEVRYLSLFHDLLILLHCEEIDESIIENWCNDMSILDIRILLCIFQLKVFGEIWCPQGLKDFIMKLKSLKLVNKIGANCEILGFIKMMKHYLKEKNSDHTLKNDISKSIDINLFEALYQREVERVRNGDEDSGFDVDIDQFETESLHAILKLLLEDESLPYRDQVILTIYNKEKMWSETIEYFRKRGDYWNFLQFLKDHFQEDLDKSYLHTEMVEDLVTIINGILKDPTNVDIVQDIIMIIEYSKIDYHVIFHKVENVKFRVSFLEKMHINDDNDKDFLLEYYISKLEETILQEKIWEKFNQVIGEYRDDLDYFKVDCYHFLEIKLKHEFRSVKMYCDKIIEICDDNVELQKNSFESVRKFDQNDILLVVLFFRPEPVVDNNNAMILECDMIDTEEKMGIFMQFKDFQQVDLHCNKSNIIEIFQWFTQVANEPYVSEIICKFLVRKFEIFAEDTSLIKDILSKVPSDSIVNVLMPFIGMLLKTQMVTSQRTNIHKIVLRNELKNCDKVISFLQEEK